MKNTFRGPHARRHRQCLPCEVHVGAHTRDMIYIRVNRASSKGARLFLIKWQKLHQPVMSLVRMRHVRTHKVFVFVYDAYVSRFSFPTPSLLSALVGAHICDMIYLSQFTCTNETCVHLWNIHDRIRRIRVTSIMSGMMYISHVTRGCSIFNGNCHMKNTCLEPHARRRCHCLHCKVHACVTWCI